MKIFNQLKSPASLLNKTWHIWSKFPCGKYLFSKVVGKIIPYTGSISSVVQHIENGYVAVKLTDKKKIRNHLNSIHAIALANLSEFTTGLSVISQLKANAKAILVKIEVTYLKKARGTLTAEARSSVPDILVQDTDVAVTADIKNAANELVCQAVATWRVRP